MKASRITAGIIAGSLVGWFVCAVYVLAWNTLRRHPGGSVGPIIGYTIYPNLLLVPMVMGVTATYFWKELNLGIWSRLLWSFVMTIVCLAGAYLLLKEGTICLVLVSPLLLICIFSGTEIGSVWFKSDRGKLNLTILPLLVLVILAESKTRDDRKASVTDQLLVRASVAQVWKFVTAFPEIKAAPHYWLFKAGLPSPVATTCEGAFVGADRRCIFSNGLEFKEIVSELTPNQLLTFDIVDQPHDPELMGHLTLHRGQFALRDNGDGTTTLIGTSWYTLHVRPLWYFDWWTRDITRHVHLRVMEHIKELAETGK